MVTEVLAKHTQPEYWAKAVLRKLYYLRRHGADFKNTRWNFDWDIDLLNPINSANCLFEHNALRMLQNLNVLSIQEKKINDSPSRYTEATDYRIAPNIYDFPKVDYPNTHYAWAIWLTSFNNKEFLKQCKEYGVSTKLNGINASLSFELFSKPVVRINDVFYGFAMMNENAKPFLMVEYCYRKPNESISLDTLIVKKNIKGVTNIKESLKHTLFHKNAPLHYFINVTPKSLMVMPIVKLAEHQVEDIIKNSTIFSEN